MHLAVQKAFFGFYLVLERERDHGEKFHSLQDTAGFGAKSSVVAKGKPLVGGQDTSEMLGSLLRKGACW